jgi:hypothetical protein
MSWVISVSVDLDKTAAPAVGQVTATFTDADGSAFSFSQRSSFTSANGDKFVADAIAARNAWQTKQKAAETGALNILVAKFTNAGETATAAPVT